MEQAAQNFIDQTDKVAKKYKAKVSIGVPGEKEVVIADHTGDETGEAEVLISLEGLIKGHVDSIEKLKEEKKQKAEMLKDSYANDATYKDLDDKAKAARKQATVIKGRILQQPSNVRLKGEVSELSAELREKADALSDYLLEYKRISGATQLDLFGGMVGEIVLSARIVKLPK